MRTYWNKRPQRRTQPTREEAVKAAQERVKEFRSRVEQEYGTTPVPIDEVHPDSVDSGSDGGGGSGQ